MKLVPLSLVMLFITITTTAQLVELDLARSPLNNPAIGLDRKGVKLINKLPRKKYQTTIKVEEQPNAADVKSLSSNCDNDAYATARVALVNEKEEANVKSRLAALEAALAGVPADCKAELTADFNALKAATTEEIFFKDFTLARNQNIIVTVVRLDDKGNEEKRWVAILSTPIKLNYVTHFGFTYVPNGQKKSDNYFSKADTGNTFIITQQNKNGDNFWKDASLTANLIVYPFKIRNEDAGVKVGLSAGLGISGEARFTAFVGPAFVFSNFLSLHCGVGVYNKSLLRGEYTAGDRIKEKLEFDQLHERGIRPAFVISLGLRLNKDQLTEMTTIGGK